MNKQIRIYRFANFVLNTGTRKLSDAGGHIFLNDKGFDILVSLIEESPEVVSKDTIVERVWCGVAVEDNSVERAIVSIRKALGDDAKNPRYIKTVRGRGYLFIGDLAIDRPITGGSNDVIAKIPSWRNRILTLGGLGVFVLGLLIAFALATISKSETIIELFTRDVIFRDDFSETAINQAKWTISGNAVRLENGSARITVDEVGQGGRIESTKITVDPQRPFLIKSRVKVSYNRSVAGNLDFIGTFGIRPSELEASEVAPSLVGIKYANAEGEFCYPGNIVKAEGFYLVRADGDVRVNSDHVRGKIGPQTEGVWDRWFDQHLEYNPVDRVLTLTIDGELKGQFKLDETDLANGESVYLTVSPHGWWLHHSIELDYVEISQPKLLS